MKSSQSDSTYYEERVGDMFHYCMFKYVLQWLHFNKIPILVNIGINENHCCQIYCSVLKPEEVLYQTFHSTLKIISIACPKSLQ